MRMPQPINPPATSAVIQIFTFESIRATGALVSSGTSVMSAPIHAHNKNSPAKAGKSTSTGYSKRNARYTAVSTTPQSSKNQSDESRNAMRLAIRRQGFKTSSHVIGRLLLVIVFRTYPRDLHRGNDRS